MIVLSWNRKDAVVACVARIKSSSCRAHEIVVVDNASSDGSPEAIAAAHPDVTVLRESTNRGFAGGVNRGLAEAARRGADFAWLLNDDSAIDASTLAGLVDFAQTHPGTGLLTPRILDFGDAPRPQFDNGLVDWRASLLLHNLPGPLFESKLQSGDASSIVPGTALLCDMRVYATIGPFDERFFAYWEDTDYSIRASRAGFANTVAAALAVRHAATPTSFDRPPHYFYYMLRNEALFWRLHHPDRLPFKWMRLWFARSLLWAAGCRDRGLAEHADACVDGMWHALTRRYGPRSDHSPAPRLVRRIILARPYLLAFLLQGRFAWLISRLRGIPARSEH